MKLRMPVAVVIVAVFVFCGAVSGAEQDEIRAKIDQLLHEAREMDERADILRAEAEELERMLVSDGERIRRPEAVELEVMELMERAEQAHKDGRLDEAADLRAEAEGLAQQLRERPRRERPDEIDRLERHVHELIEMAEQAEKAGNRERAERLRAEARESKRHLRREAEQREQAQGVEKLDREIAELHEASEKARHSGRHHEAERLQRRVEEIETNLHRHHLELKAAGMKREIAHLHELAADKKRQGRHEEAKAIMAEAGNLERRLHEMVRGPECRPEALVHRVDVLQDQVNGLRHQIAEIRQMLHEKMK